MNDSLSSLCAAFLLTEKQFDASSWAPLPYRSPCRLPPPSPLSPAPRVPAPQHTLADCVDGPAGRWKSWCSVFHEGEGAAAMLNSLRRGCVSCGGDDGETGLQPLDFTPRLQVL